MVSFNTMSEVCVCCQKTVAPGKAYFCGLGWVCWAGCTKECVACLDASGFGETAIPHTCGKSESGDEWGRHAECSKTGRCLIGNGLCPHFKPAECTCRFNAEGVLLDVLGCEVHDKEDENERPYFDGGAG